MSIARTFTLTSMKPVTFNGQTYDGVQVAEEMDQTMSFGGIAPGAGAGLGDQSQHGTYAIQMARGVGFTSVTSTLNGETIITTLTAYQPAP
jgi:hypothetical protein